jgi:hypothetical protein
MGVRRTGVQVEADRFERERTQAIVGILYSSLSEDPLSNGDLSARGAGFHSFQLLKE